MSTTTAKKRGARVYVEFDQDLTKAIDAARKPFGLSRIDFTRLVVARQVLPAEVLNVLAVEKAR